MGQKESLPFAGVIEQLDRDREEGREGGLSNLTLEKVRIDEAAAKAFADYMRRREALQLKFIQLGGCGLTYAAFHHLVEAICSRAPSLKRLDLVSEIVSGAFCAILLECIVEFSARTFCFVQRMQFNHDHCNS